MAVFDDRGRVVVPEGVREGTQGVSASLGDGTGSSS